MSNDNWKVGCIVRRDRKELMALMVKETEVALWTLSMDDWTWQFMTKAEPGQGYEGIPSTQLSGMMGCAYSISVGFIAILKGKNNRLQGLLYDGPHRENSKWTVLDMDAAAGIDPSTIALWVTGDNTYMYGALRNKNTVAFGVLEKGNRMLRSLQDSWGLNQSASAVSMAFSDGYLYLAEARTNVWLSRVRLNTSNPTIAPNFQTAQTLDTGVPSRSELLLSTDGQSQGLVFVQASYNGTLSSWEGGLHKSIGFTRSETVHEGRITWMALRPILHVIDPGSLPTAVIFDAENPDVCYRSDLTYAGAWAQQSISRSPSIAPSEDLGINVVIIIGVGALLLSVIGVAVVFRLEKTRRARREMALQNSLDGGHHYGFEAGAILLAPVVGYGVNNNTSLMPSSAPPPMPPMMAGAYVAPALSTSPDHFPLSSSSSSPLDIQFSSHPRVNIAMTIDPEDSPPPYEATPSTDNR